MWYLPYDKDLKAFSQKLRNNSTIGEIALWKQLRAGQLMGYPFNRQKPLHRYIVDFYCKPLNLVIEVDGQYHYEPQQMLKDKAREKVLQEMGLQFLRFSEQQVRRDMPMVLHTIQQYIIAFEKGDPLS